MWSTVVLSPIARAWLGSKANNSRSFHLSPRTSSVTAEMTSICTMSELAIPRMLPNTIVLRLMLLGNTEMMSTPAAKKVVKTRPMTASSRIVVLALIHPMTAAAARPEANAPTANGTPMR